jgi:hypothetical protein
VRTHRVVTASPILDDYLSLVETVEDPLLQHFIPKLTSVTPVERIASAID